VHLVGHHALDHEAFRGESDPALRDGAREVPPFYVRIEQAGRDVTAEVNAQELLLSPYPLAQGPATHFLTAGSTVSLARALLQDDETFLHVPGPAGLPGGYPVHASRAGVRVASIPDLTLDEAIAINERSHRFDGIDRIEADGTVVFVDESADVMAEILEYDCRRLQPSEAPDRAVELMERFRSYAVPPNLRS
jgi:hypothetical protein